MHAFSSSLLLSQPTLYNVILMLLYKLLELRGLNLQEIPLNTLFYQCKYASVKPLNQIL